MRKFIFPKKDTTIYSKHLTKSYGLDEIIEFQKEITGSIVNNSRILMYFDISELNQSANSKYYLNLKTCNGNNLTPNINIEVYPISGTWMEGDGTHLYSSESGSSWSNRTYNDEWVLEGGDYYTSSIATVEYDTSNIDMRVDVTDIVYDWISGSYNNDGFLLKRSELEESGSDSREELQFYSKDTHTVYLPTLEEVYDDSVYPTSSLDTGSYEEILDDRFIISMQNFKKQYLYNTVIRFRPHVRKMHRRKTFLESYSSSKIFYLPETFFYEIRDAYSGYKIMEFDELYNKISLDTEGHYFDIDMGGLMPNRFYEIIFKTTINGIDVYTDNNYIFKVVL